MENKKLILEQKITKLATEALIEKYQSGQIDEAGFASAMGGLKNLAGKVANKFVDKAQQVKQGLSDVGNEIKGSIKHAGSEIADTARGIAKNVSDTTQNIKQGASNAAGQIKTAYKQGALPVQRQETEKAFETFVKSLSQYNQEARKYGTETLSIQGMLNKYRRVYPNLFKESEEPILNNQPINESNEIKYKGKTINVLKTGFYEYYSDKEGRFLKFDTLKDCKDSINQEESLNESKDNKWMQDVDMKKGKLKKRLGLGEDEKLTISRVNSELKKLKDKYKEGEKMSKSDLTFEKELVLAKTLLSSKK